jgi:hypothetical protein
MIEVSENTPWVEVFGQPEQTRLSGPKGTLDESKAQLRVAYRVNECNWPYPPGNTLF